MYLPLHQIDLYNYNTTIKPIELNQEQIAVCKSNIISALLMTPQHIKNVRNKDALLHIVWSQEIVDLIMSDKPFPLNYEA